MTPEFFLISGIGTFIYSLFAAANYYTLSGEDMIDSKDAKKMIKNGTIQYVIDVRTDFERKSLGFYPNSIHIPVTDMNEKRLSKIPRNSSVLVYCNTGQRARKAAEILKEKGYSKVYYIAGTYQSLL